MTHMLNKETVNVSAHIPKILAEKLDKISKIEERSKSYYIKKSLEQFLAERLEDIEDYYDAQEAWQEFKESGQKGISFEQICKDLKL